MRRLLPLLVVIVLALLAWSSGVADLLDWEALARNQRELSAWVAGHPVLGGAGYVLLYGAVVSLSLPLGSLFSAAGGLLFGPIAGTLLAATAATAGASALFLAARWAIGSALAARGGPRLQALRRRLQHDGFHYLLAIRLIPLFPFWLVNLAAALCGIRLPTFVLATALGILPVTGIIAWTGSRLGQVLAAGPGLSPGSLLTFPILAPLMALAALSLLPLLWRRAPHA
jgi:uncharacterized membrane protein YdjX (TVP38/TMEM64 family)